MVPTQDLCIATGQSTPVARTNERTTSADNNVRTNGAGKAVRTTGAELPRKWCSGLGQQRPTRELVTHYIRRWQGLAPAPMRTGVLTQGLRS